MSENRHIRCENGTTKMNIVRFTRKGDTSFSIIKTSTMKYRPCTIVKSMKPTNIRFEDLTDFPNKVATSMQNVVCATPNIKST